MLTREAAYGELHFEMFGFLCQTSAVVVSDQACTCTERGMLTIDPV
jgi:hypothetical protein